MKLEYRFLIGGELKKNHKEEVSQEKSSQSSMHGTK